MWLYESGYAIFNFLSSFMTYHQVCNKSDTISATSGGGPATFQEHLSSPSGFSAVRVARSLVFCVLSCGSLFVLYHLDIVLSVLRITASDFFFGIFKLFFIEKRVDIFNVYAINLIMLSKPKVHKYSPKQPVTLLGCKLDSFSPSKSLHIIDVVNVCFLLSHLQNGVLLQPTQSIANSLEIKKNISVYN